MIKIFSIQIKVYVTADCNANEQFCQNSCLSGITEQCKNPAWSGEQCDLLSGNCINQI